MPFGSSQRSAVVVAPEAQRRTFDPLPQFLTNRGDFETLRFQPSWKPDAETDNEMSAFQLGELLRSYREGGELPIGHLVSSSARRFQNLYFGRPYNEGTVLELLAVGTTGNPAFLSESGPLANAPELEAIIAREEPGFNSQEYWENIHPHVRSILAANGVGFEEFQNVKNRDGFEYLMTWHLFGIWANQQYELRAGRFTRILNGTVGFVTDPITGAEVAGGTAATAIMTPLGGAIADIAIGGVGEGVRSYYEHDGRSTLYRLSGNPEYNEQATAGDFLRGAGVGLLWGGVMYGGLWSIGKAGRWLTGARDDVVEQIADAAEATGADPVAARVGAQIANLEAQFRAGILPRAVYEARRADLLGATPEAPTPAPKGAKGTPAGKTVATPRPLTPATLELLHRAQDLRSKLEDARSRLQNLRQTKEPGPAYTSVVQAVRSEVDQIAAQLEAANERVNTLRAAIADRVGQIDPATGAAAPPSGPTLDQLKAAEAAAPPSGPTLDQLKDQLKAAEARASDLLNQYNRTYERFLRVNEASLSARSSRRRQIENAQAEVDDLKRQLRNTEWTLKRATRPSSVPAPKTPEPPRPGPVDAATLRGDVGNAVLDRIEEVGETLQVASGGNVLGRVADAIGHYVPWFRGRLSKIATMSGDRARMFLGKQGLVLWRANITGLNEWLTVRSMVRPGKSIRTVRFFMHTMQREAAPIIVEMKELARARGSQFGELREQLWRALMTETAPDDPALKELYTKIRQMADGFHQKATSLGIDLGYKHYPFVIWKRPHIRARRTEFTEALTKAFWDTVESSPEHWKSLVREMKEQGITLTSLADLDEAGKAAVREVLKRRAASAMTNLLGEGELRRSAVRFNHAKNAGFTKEVLLHPALDPYFIKDAAEGIEEYMHSGLVHEMATRSALLEELGMIFPDDKPAMDYVDEMIRRRLDQMPDQDAASEMRRALDTIREKEDAWAGRSPQVIKHSNWDSFASVVNNLLRAKSGAFWAIPAAGEASLVFLTQLVDNPMRIPALMRFTFAGVSKHNLKHLPVVLERWKTMNRHYLELGEEAGGFMFSSPWNPIGHLKNAASQFSGTTDILRGRAQLQGANRFVSAAERLSHGLGHFATEGGGLRLITNATKDLSMGAHMDNLASNTKRLRSLKAALSTVTDERSFRAAARKAGLDPELAAWYSEKGLLDDDTFEAMMGFLEDPKHLQRAFGAKYLNLDSMYREAGEDLVKRRAVDKLVDFLETMAQKEVASPNVLDTFGNQHWTARLIFSLTTFPRAFASRTVERLFYVPNHKMAVMMGGMALASIITIYGRRLLDGEDLEDINAEFVDDPEGFLLRVFAETPIMGPWGYTAAGFVNNVMGEGRMPDPLGGAGLTELSRLARMGTQTARAIAQQDLGQLTDTTKADMANHVPLWNWWQTQAAVQFFNKMTERRPVESRGGWRGWRPEDIDIYESEYWQEYKALMNADN